MSVSDYGEAVLHGDGYGDAASGDGQGGGEARMLFIARRHGGGYGDAEGGTGFGGGYGAMHGDIQGRTPHRDVYIQATALCRA